MLGPHPDPVTGSLQDGVGPLAVRQAVLLPVLLLRDGGHRRWPAQMEGGEGRTTHFGKPSSCIYIGDTMSVLFVDEFLERLHCA